MISSGATAVLDFAGQTSRHVFISYRREDTEGHVLALVPPMRARFGEDRVFKDTDNIPPGKDFVEALQREVASCSVMLVVIGRNWLTTQDPKTKSRRLDNPSDFVRIEVATALENERILVVPVLVGGATMPAAQDLPPNLQSLTRRQASELTGSHWLADIQKLIQVIETWVGPTPPPRLAFRRGLQAGGAVAVVLIALLAFWRWEREEIRPDLPETGLAGRPSEVPTTNVVTPPVLKPDAVLKDPQPRSNDGPIAGRGRASTAKEVPISPASPKPKSPVDERALQSLRDAEAIATQARQRAEIEKASDSELKAANQKRLEAERLRDDGQVGSAIQTFLSAAREFDAAPRSMPAPEPPKPEPGPVGSDAVARNRADSAIRQTLDRFRQAYSEKNEGGLRAVYPQVRADRLFENLEVCKRVSLTYSQMAIRLLSATEALADVVATYGCQPPTGQGMLMSKPVRDTFRLVQKGPEWVIDRRQITLDEP